MKTKQASKELLEQHYKDLVAKPFFLKLRGYMLSGPVVCMIWEGKEAVSTGRKMLGATNPLESAPGTIRGDFCIEVSQIPTILTCGFCSKALTYLACSPCLL